MKVAKGQQQDVPSRSFSKKDNNEFVIVATMSGSALHGLTPSKPEGSTATLPRLAIKTFRIIDRSSMQGRLVGARLPRPVQLETVGHPEAERDLVLHLPPKLVTRARVNLHDVGRAKPRLVLDDNLTDE
jgi:hypothetical protein